MRGKLVALAALLTTLVGSVEASVVNWSWSFTPSTVFISPEMETPGASPGDFTTYFYLPYTVTNNVTSDVEIRSPRFLLGSGTNPFPTIIKDAEGRDVLIPTSLAVPIGPIAPGQQVLITSALRFAANSYFFEDIAKGESFVLDPSLVAIYYPILENLSAVIVEQKGSVPLVLTAAVPEPSTFGLFFLGLGFLVCAKNQRQRQTP